MNELEPVSALTKHHIFEAFVIQLRKDFECAGFALPDQIIIQQNYSELVEQISGQIKLLSKSTGLQALLYRIDVSEQQIKQAASRFPDKSYEHLISELIIKRILQKVILKQHFSSKP